MEPAMWWEMGWGDPTVATCWFDYIEDDDDDGCVELNAFQGKELVDTFGKAICIVFLKNLNFFY
jgi:hypothetical protein